jgi:sulfur transfer protein SufE
MFKEKIEEYKSTIETLELMDSLEVYSYLMQKGQELNKDALGESRRIQENKVTQCMYDLYVDKEDERFKAWSEATIAAGYAFILVDIFNSMTDEEAKTVTVKDFEKMELDKKLTMNRQTGYFQMIEIMLNKVK